MIFTSGSTGRPKGVLIEHGALCNHIAWVREAFDLVASDRFLLRTPITFDASLWEIVHPLVAGACLVVAPPDVQRDPLALLRLVRDARISVLQTVPSMLRTWLEERAFDACASLRHLICAGEALLVPLAREVLARWRGAGVDARLHNLYGPSEATIDASMASCTWDELAATRRQSVPIGRPITNTTLHVVDARGEPVPPGVVGELLVGGPGLARGYLRRPDLTGERFVPDPFGAGRAYRTGDLARRLPDGRLESVGRRDGQIKLRGHRVELGEVEAVLGTHPDLRDVAVLADPPEAPVRLVAYVVAARGRSAPEPQHLRAWLGERLPAHMLPSLVAVLDAIPRTSSEKLDRKALPSPASLARGTSRDPDDDRLVAPRSATERRVAELFAELLDVGRLGLHDDFFALGGHSLLVSRLAARSAAAFGVEVPLLRFFEGPTVAAWAAAIDAALAALDLAPDPRPSTAEPIARVPRDGPLLPTPGQERLLLLGRLEPDATHYAVPGALRLRGPLDAAALTRAFDFVVARHESLRACFPERDGRHVLHVQPPPRDVLQVETHAGLAPDARVEVAERRLTELCAVPFDLARGPLMRARLLRFAADDHVLLLVQHHVITDAWSLRVLADELSRAYAACVRGGDPELPPLPSQLADVAAWQRERLDAPRARAQLDAWRTLLADAPVELALPRDRRRPVRATHSGARTRLALDAGLATRLRALARESGTTLFVTLLAAWDVLLLRLTGETDLVLGTTFVNRPHVDMHALLGFFVETLPVRVDLDGAADFAEVVTRVGAALDAARRGADVPFERIVETVVGERHPSRPPLVQVAFDLLESLPPPDFAGLRCEALDFEPGTSKVDLAALVEDRGEGLTLVLEYDTALFDAQTVAHWATLYERILRAVAEDARLAPDALPPWRADDEQQPAALHETPRSVATPPPVAKPRSHETLPSLAARVLTHARATPGAVAVIDADGETSYAQLVARAADVARRLTQRGVGEGDLLAVCLPRSSDLLALLLAVDALGAAWLPVDPCEPVARRVQVLRAARPRLRLGGTSDVELAQALPELDELVLARDEVSTPDEARDEVSTPDEARDATDASRPSREIADFAELAERARDPLSAAYVLFTSGSTGRPKGVVVPRRAPAHHTPWVVRHLGLDAHARVLARLPPTFDAAQLELLPALAAGGSVVFAPPDGASDPDVLAAWIVRHRVSVLVGTPALLAALVTRPQLAGAHALRHLLCGGEAMSDELPTRVAALARAGAPTPVLHHFYGPTEACVDATVHVCAADERNTPPLGHPLPYVTLRLLDRRGRPVPRGVVGEIALGGPGLFSGYLHDDALTAASCLDDPLAPGKRLYRTGDLARRRGDGRLEFVGRRDGQVKLRGRRTEPGEIEATLRALDGVCDAAVATPAARDGTHALVAFVVGSLTEVEVIDAARAALPAALVPDAVVVLDALPRLPSGKLDRRDLLRRGRARLAGARRPATRDEQPRDDLERLVARRFADVLQRTPIGRHDDFFVLGGHSLSALRLLTLLAEDTGRALPLRTLFETPRVRDVAKVLGQAGAESEAEAEAVTEAAACRAGPDLRALAVLPDDVRPARSGRGPRTPMREVLLTGATGYLGAFLLRELLDGTDLVVDCLVRARDPDEGRARLAESLRRRELDADLGERVRVVLGDLALPGLGLAQQTRARLVGVLDGLLHAGARVHFLHRYETLAPSNVGGTCELLRLCCEAGGCPLHLVSSLGVLLAPDVLARARLDEDIPLDALAGVVGGYEQTKWVAESLVQQARARGLPVSVSRPGRIAGHSARGVWNEEDAAALVFLGCLALGAWPDLGGTLDVTPVDFVARAIVHVLLHGPHDGRPLHLVNPSPTPFALVFEAARARGLPLRAVSHEAWQELLRQVVLPDPDHPLHALLPLVATPAGQAPRASDVLLDLLLPPVGHAHADAVLSAAGLHCPPVDATLVGRWLDGFAARGMLPGAEPRAPHADTSLHDAAAGDVPPSPMKGTP